MSSAEKALGRVRLTVDPVGKERNRWSVVVVMVRFKSR